MSFEIDIFIFRQSTHCRQLQPWSSSVCMYTTNGIVVDSVACVRIKFIIRVKALTSGAGAICWTRWALSPPECHSWRRCSCRWRAATKRSSAPVARLSCLVEPARHGKICGWAWIEHIAFVVKNCPLEDSYATFYFFLFLITFLKVLRRKVVVWFQVLYFISL